MKTVKLDKRHRAFHDGYTHAYRFDAYSGYAAWVEMLLRDAYDRHSWTRKESKVWHSEFGSRQNGCKIFWIYFRDESVITYILLNKGKF